MIPRFMQFVASRLRRGTIATGNDITVAVYANWDFAPSFAAMSRSGNGVWDGVRFALPDEVEQPDFVLVLNAPGRDVEIDMPPERVWFASGEPPPFRRFNEGQGEGTIILTCDAALAAELAGRREYVLAPPHIQTWSVNRTYRELAALGPTPKPRVLSWVTSNKVLFEGHRRRMVFLAWIRHSVPMDVFGYGFDPIEDKWDALAPYRYSIAFENHRSPHYFTEKIMDCFVCRTMPLYFGCPDIGRFFPSGSFVEFDPDDRHVADRINEVINSNLYMEQSDAIEEARWLVLEKYNTVSRLANFISARQSPPGRARRMTLRA